MRPVSVILFAVILLTFDLSVNAQGDGVDDWKLYSPEGYEKPKDTAVAISTPNLPRYDGPGEVRKFGEPGVEVLSDRYVELNIDNPKIDGFRIRIAATGPRDKARSEKSRFLTLFPKIRADLDYQEPNWIVAVGQYRNRLDALRYLQEIRIHFPGAIIVQERISLPDLELPEEIDLEIE